jgi:hypothetical protein
MSDLWKRLVRNLIIRATHSVLPGKGVGYSIEDLERILVLGDSLRDV